MIRSVARRARIAGALAAACALLPPVIARAETADEFVARLNKQFAELGLEINAAGWTQATYINVDTELLSAKATEHYLEAFSNAVEEAKKFDGQPMTAASKRSIELLKLGVAAPAPNDPVKRAELAKLLAGMESKYGSAKYCPSGPDSCRDQTQLKEVLEKSRNYDELLAAWKGWHEAAGRPLRADYVRYVELANEGARELGYKDLGAMWRSGYDMPADDFAKEAARLYAQVEPFYKDTAVLRARPARERSTARTRCRPASRSPRTCSATCGRSSGTATMTCFEPYPGVSNLDVDSALVKQGYDSIKMTKNAESVLPVDRLPGAARHVLGALDAHAAARPRRRMPRERLAHGRQAKDVRIKMCIRPTQEELRTIYHELGHVYYFLWYKDQPYLFQNGAHDGFHEAIGDTITLSMTPSYLAQIGLVPAAAAKQGSGDQPADEDGAREDRVPAVRQADRRMALEGVLRRDHARELQRGVVGAAREVPGRRAAGGAHGTRFRPGREVPHSRQHAVHALFPVIHHPVPVPEGAVRVGRLQGPALPSARSSAARKPARSSPRCCRRVRASRGRTRCTN